ncbi:MAG: tetratricopeptide repeat protein [Nitrospinota bacterium]|nr:tetratricopeptide repeat protein [Nitrospinota bacterium]MDH5789560.1 tetratricopeptide repeat protein [Nitrospinota bacterium]
MKRFWNIKGLLLFIGFALLVAMPFLIIQEKQLPMLTDNTLNPYPEPKDLAGSYIQKASEHYFYGEFPQAADNYHKAIALYEERKDIHRVATTYDALGDLYVWAREPEEAEKNYLIAAQHHAQADNLMEQANSIKEIADMHVKHEKFQEAEKRYSQSLDLMKSEKPNRVVGSIHEGMGHMYWKANQIPEAIDSFTHARDTFVTLHYNLGIEQMTGIIKRLNRLLETQRQRKSSTQKDNTSH